jgi:hypothetical protein
MAAESKVPSIAQRDKSLPLAVPVQVQCDGFRCLAYRNLNGKWVDYYTGKLLEGSVHLIEYKMD